MLPALLSLFGREHPLIRVRAAVGDSMGVIAQVERGEVGLGLVGRKTDSPHLEFRYLACDRMVLVASYGGDDRNPAWFLNLRDDPNVEVTTKGQPKRRMVARIANAEERARLWPLVTADHKNYAGYQTKTDREIPLVLLEPPV